MAALRRQPQFPAYEPEAVGQLLLTDSQSSDSALQLFKLLHY